MNAHRKNSIRGLLLASGVIAALVPALAAEVTPERLVNADREPRQLADEPSHL